MHFSRVTSVAPRVLCGPGGERMSRVYGRDVQIARDAGPVSDTRVGVGWFPGSVKTSGRAANRPTTSAQPHSTRSSAAGMFQLPVAECSSPNYSGPALATRYPADCAKADSEADTPGSGARATMKKMASARHDP